MILAISIAEVMGSNPIQAWIFFRSYFNYQFSSVYSCKDLLFSFLHCSAHIWFSYIYCHYLCFLFFSPGVWYILPIPTVNPSLFYRMWTCFEHTLMNVTELMKDRHIDQILMCCIYVMGKVIHFFSEQNLVLCVVSCCKG